MRACNDVRGIFGMKNIYLVQSRVPCAQFEKMHTHMDRDCFLTISVTEDAKQSSMSQVNTSSADKETYKDKHKNKHSLFLLFLFSLFSLYDHSESIEALFLKVMKPKLLP